MNKSNPPYQCPFKVPPNKDNAHLIKAFDFFRRFAPLLKITPPSFYEFYNALKYDSNKHSSKLLLELFYSQWKAINSEHSSGQYLFYLFRGGKITRYEWPTIVKIASSAQPLVYSLEGLHDDLSSILSLEQFNTKSFEFKTKLLCSFVNIIAINCKKFKIKKNSSNRSPGMENINLLVKPIPGEAVSGNQYFALKEENYDIVAVVTPDNLVTFIHTQEEFQKHYEYAREEGIDLAYYDEISTLRIPKKSAILKNNLFIERKISFDMSIKRGTGPNVLEDKDTLEKLSEELGFQVLGHMKHHDLEEIKKIILEPEALWYEKMVETKMHYIDFNRDEWITEMKKATTLKEIATQVQTITEIQYQPHYQDRPKTVRGILGLNRKYLVSPSVLEQCVNFKMFSRFEYEIVKYNELAKNLMSTISSPLKRTRNGRFSRKNSATLSEDEEEHKQLDLKSYSRKARSSRSYSVEPTTTKVRYQVDQRSSRNSRGKREFYMLP